MWHNFVYLCVSPFLNGEELIDLQRTCKAAYNSISKKSIVFKMAQLKLPVMSVYHPKPEYTPDDPTKVFYSAFVRDNIIYKHVSCEPFLLNNKIDQYLDAHVLRDILRDDPIPLRVMVFCMNGLDINQIGLDLVTQ